MMAEILQSFLELKKPQNQLKETPIVLICPKPNCFLIPQCSIIIENKEPQVRIKCECGLKESFSVSSFLFELKKINNNNNMQKKKCWRTKKHVNNPPSLNSIYYCVGCSDWVCEKCFEEEKQTVNEKSYHKLVQWKILMNNKCENKTNHGYIKATNYCVDCKKNLCQDCLMNHKGHNLFNFQELSQKKIEHIVENYKKGNEKLNKNKEIYLEFIKTVRGEITKLQGIESVIANKYHQNEAINNSIKELLNIIISNYQILKDIPNYNLQNNFLSIDKFDFDTISLTFKDQTVDIEKSYTSLCFGLEDNYLLKDNPFHIKNIQCQNVLEVKNHICALTVLKNGYIVSGSDQGEVLVFNPSLEHIKTYHVNCVTSLYEFKTNVVAVCGYSIILCYIDQEKQNKTLILSVPKSSGKFQKIITINNNKLASFSEEKLIRIWDSFLPYSESSVLKGHKSPIKSMIYLSDGRIVSISSKELIFWIYDDYEKDYIKQKTMEDIECSNLDSLIELGFSNQILVGGNSSATLVDIISYQKQIKITPRYVVGDISSMIAFGNKTDGNVLFLIDGIILQLGNNSEMEILKRVHEKDKSYCMAKGKDGNSFITCCTDGLIKKWVIGNSG